MLPGPEPRKTRRSYHRRGQSHVLTCSCLHRWPLLNNDRVRTWMIEAMETMRRVLDVDIRAYVIMPEHVHIIIRPTHDDCSIPRVLSLLKRPVSVAARDYLRSIDSPMLSRLSVTKHGREVFRFWQPGGGFDHNIRADAFPRHLRYVHENPVRRGLVSSAEEWYWSSASWWSHRGGCPLEPDVNM